MTHKSKRHFFQEIAFLVALQNLYVWRKYAGAAVNTYKEVGQKVYGNQ